ncbi:MAG: hypothetical protein ABFS30_18155, partial [Pseudomonadota bacterium]
MPDFIVNAVHLRRELAAQRLEVAAREAVTGVHVERGLVLGDCPEWLARGLGLLRGAVVALGETFVILGGGFDLSIASTVSLIAAVASGEMAGKAENIFPTIALCLGIGTSIGLINGLVVTKLKVPSFLTTLGMMI